MPTSIVIIKIFRITEKNGKIVINPDGWVKASISGPASLRNGLDMTLAKGSVIEVTLEGKTILGIKKAFQDKRSSFVRY